MVTPCQNGPAEEYAHLGSFLRSAPLEQVRNLWQTLGRTVEKTLSAQGRSESEPLWVSTNGIGMPWVHLRLDMSPRYFHYTLWKLHPQKLLKEEQASRASFSAPAPSTSTPRLPADSIQQDLGNQEPPGASEQGPGSDVRRRTPSHNCNPSDSSTHIRVGSDDLSFGGSGILLGVSSSSIKTVSSEDDLYAASNSDMKVKLGCFSACMGRLRVNRKPPGRRRAGRRSSLTSSSHLPPVQLGRLGPWGADMSVSRRQALLANHH